MCDIAGAKAADSKPGPKPGQKRSPVSSNVSSRESPEPPKRRKLEAGRDQQGRCGLSSLLLPIKIMPKQYHDCTVAVILFTLRP